MSLSLSSQTMAAQPAAAIVVGAYGDGSLTPAAMSLDQAMDGAISRLQNQHKLNLKTGQSTVLLDTGKIAAERVLVICVGEDPGISERGFEKAVSAAISAGQAFGELAIALSDVAVKDKDAAWAMKRMVVTAMATSYRFLECKSADDSMDAPINIIAISDGSAEQEAAFALGCAIASGSTLARDLGNRPGNICTPSHLADQAQSLADTHPSITVNVLEESDMTALGMGALLSVARGSRQPPKLIAMEYKGASKQSAKPIVLVGKGITFDSGGISIKPSAAMDEMKFDMCGAASVLGTFKAIAELHLPLNVVGLIPSCENMPDGIANKPGDIVTSMSGQTIEVLNTDAEGRLILCDALSYAERYEPTMMVDIATLTGACVIALGGQASGLFSNDDELADALLAAGEVSGDRAWRMPLWDAYGEALKSNFADVANIGGREAGSITAACFLSRFTKEQRWAHLDIAGTAWKSGGDKGATGRPVGLLVEFLAAQSPH